MTRSVVLLGRGTQAIRIAEWFRVTEGYELSYVVPMVPEPAWSDSLIGWCIEHEVPYIRSGDYRDIPDVLDGEWYVDLGITVFCDDIIKPWFINRCGRILNLHNGPLPKYRGVNPINWALKNGERTHGVTLHEITPGIDNGPIVSQVTFTIDPDRDEVIDVHNRCLAFGYTLFEQTMPILNRIVARRQNEAEATYYSKRDFAKLGDRSNFTRALSKVTV